ncbi:MAG: linear amide C-N hydrolase [Legionella sp.]|nr:linear amide C-N hydrolase [Legionella sp.]
MKWTFAVILTHIINLIALPVFACTEVFLYRNNVALIGRTMDFPINVSTNMVGYNKGIKQVSTYMRPTSNDATKVAEWTVDYPYLGREILNTGLIVDGANVEGLSAAFLYLPGTQYPSDSTATDKSTLSFFDLGSFALATSKNVDEALANIQKHRISKSALAISPKIAIKDAPLHLSLKDKHGHSAVIEAINGELKIYRGEKAGKILTNWPPLPEQYKNLENYRSLLNYDQNAQKSKFANIPGFEVMMESSSLRDNIKSMVGIPGDYSPPSRFVRATYLEKNIPFMKEPNNYYYPMEHILNSVFVPYSALPNSTATLWYTIKDLTHNRITYKNSMFLYQGKLSFIGNVVETIDLNQLFSTGVKTINGEGKLSQAIDQPENYTYYSVDEYIAKH